MIALDIIERCERLGVSLRVEDGFIFPEPTGRIPADLVDEIIVNRDKLVNAIQTGRTLDRSAKYKQALFWLDAKATELRVTTNDPAYAFMIEILDIKYDHLNDVWIDAGDESFLQALREYAIAGLKALRNGIKKGVVI